MQEIFSEEELCWMRANNSFIKDERSRSLVRLIDEAFDLRREIKAIEKAIEELTYMG